MAEKATRPRSPLTYGAWALAGILATGGIVVGVLFATGTIAPTAQQTTLRVAIATFGTEVLDPSMDSQTGKNYHGHVFDYLVGAAPEGRLSNRFGVLESWKSGPDAMDYSFVLKRGIRWHDGTEVTADDISFSMSHYSRDGAACTSCTLLKDSLQRVEVDDRYKATLHLKAPDVTFMARFGPIEGDTPLLPSHHWARVGDEGLGENPLGTGPWKFVNRSAQESIHFEANLDYWDEDRVPGFEVLRLVQVPETANRVALLRTGIVDISPVGIGKIEPLKREGFTIDGPKNVISTTLRFLMAYDSNYLTSKVQFRKALTVGTDLATIVAATYPREAATLATGSALFNPVLEGFASDLPAYPYDPKLAKQLLEESGYLGETVQLFSLSAYGLLEMPLLAEMIVQDWREIGLAVETVSTQWPLLQGRLLARPQPFDDVAPAPMFHGAAPSNRPGGVLDGVRRYLAGAEGSLLAYHDTEKGSRLFEEVAGMSDGEARRRWLQELNREMYDEYWAIPTAWHHDVYALSPNLAGWTPTNGTSFDLHLETIRTTE